MNKTLQQIECTWLCKPQKYIIVFCQCLLSGIYWFLSRILSKCMPYKDSLKFRCYFYSSKLFGFIPHSLHLCFDYSKLPGSREWQLPCYPDLGLVKTGMLSPQSWNLVCRPCEDGVMPSTSSLERVQEEDLFRLWDVLISLIFFSSIPWQLFLKLSLSYTKRVYFHFLAWPMFSLYSQPFDSYRTQFPLDHSFFPSLPGISLSPFCVFWSGSFFSCVDPSAWAILPLLISKVYFILMVFISYPCVLDAEFLMESSRVPPRLFCLADSYCEKRQWLLPLLLKRREIPNTDRTLWFIWIWFLGSQCHSD